MSKRKRKREDLGFLLALASEGQRKREQWKQEHGGVAHPDSKQTVTRLGTTMLWTKGAISWLWPKVSAWLFVITFVISVLLVVAFMVAQEHLYGWARALVLIAAFILLLKTYSAAHKDGKSGGELWAITIVVMMGLIGAVGILWKLTSTLERNYWQSLPRAYVHVDDVEIGIQYDRNYPYALVAQISGHNASITATELSPTVNASISIRPLCRDAKDEKELFAHGQWANESYHPINHALDPSQTFSFHKRAVFVTMDAEGVTNTGNPFLDNWNALRSRQVVLYVLTKAIYSDRWGPIVHYSCSQFFWNGTGFQKGFCWGAYQP